MTDSTASPVQLDSDGREIWGRLHDIVYAQATALHLGLHTGEPGVECGERKRDQVGVVHVGRRKDTRQKTEAGAVVLAAKNCRRPPMWHCGNQ